MNNIHSTALLILLLLATPVVAEHDEDPRTANLQPRGHIVEPVIFSGETGIGNVHTDIAFWGQYAFQGTWLGFNIRDISVPDNPSQVSFTSCTGNQGDMVVWDNMLVRSWNSPAEVGATCDGQVVPEGFEGLHIFDISDKNDPVLVKSVALACGSHTATGVPDPANNRLLIYNSSSSSACSGFEIVEIPFNNPAAAAFIRAEPADRRCHDISVILGNAMLAACAGGDGYAMYTLAGPGSLEDPFLMYSSTVPDVIVGHTGSFTWDGAVYVFGHEPDGGGSPRCQASNSVTEKSAFFFDPATGAQVGMWTLPRPQSDMENCSIHNFAVVPLHNRYILVSGNYQSGTSVVDFTDVTSPVEIAYSDPPPIEPTDVGGAWSSYWYNNYIYESNITEGLNIFRYRGIETTSALHLDHFNPQTQEFTIELLPIQAAIAGDVNGNNTTDLSVLLRDAESGKNKLYVMDGGSGNNITTVSFGSGPVRGTTTVPDATGDLIPEFSALVEGSLVALVKDVTNGTVLGKPKFSSNFDTVAFFSVGGDLLPDGNASQHVAVVGRDPVTGKVQAWVKDVVSRNLVSRMTFSKAFVPFDAVAVDNVGDSSAMEIAVLGIDATGKVQAQVRDARTGNLIVKVSFSKQFTPLFFAAVPNAAGKLKYLAVLGRNASGVIQAQIKRASNGTPVANVKFSKSYDPRAFISFVDSNGSGGGEIGVVGVNASGVVRAQVNEIADGAIVAKINFSRNYPPVDAIAINGAAGTGQNEIAVLGQNDNGDHRLQIKDLLTGDQVKNIPVP